MTTQQRISLYERLPEIYRIKDAEQQPPYQLKSYLSVVEQALGHIDESIGSLYHDLFIDTCSDWAISYVGDLVGNTPLSGDPWTRRADVADSVALRRRKGAKAALQRLAYDLTGWFSHCVELREALVWNQNLNHQRPDISDAAADRTQPRGGTVLLRDPAVLSLLQTPFDPCAHVADLKPARGNFACHNLPNLAIYLWRLTAWQIGIVKPCFKAIAARSASIDLTKYPDAASHAVQFEAHPLERPLQLFNRGRFDATMHDALVIRVDQTPGLIPWQRITDDSTGAHTEAYVSIESYDDTLPTLDDATVPEQGLGLHVPASSFAGETFSIRGANLCAWETGLALPLRNREVAIDPTLGRIAVGVASAAEGNALRQHLLLTLTYASPGPVGAHPQSRAPLPQTIGGESAVVKDITAYGSPLALRDALAGLNASAAPVVIQINDSLVHELDIRTVAGAVTEGGVTSLALAKPLIIRAADGQRPIVRLSAPLRFRPTKARGADASEQEKLNALMDALSVKIEGVYLCRAGASPADMPLVARAAVNSLDIVNCTLDPGGWRTSDSSRAPMAPSISLTSHYGFADALDEESFDQTPKVSIQRTICGALRVDPGFEIELTDSIVDAGSGVGADPATAAFALSAATGDPKTGWASPASLSGCTVFGRIRTEALSKACGVLFTHALEVLDNQHGCIGHSFFRSGGNRLTQHFACVFSTEAPLCFTSEVFEQPGYGQLASSCDFRIRERGPDDDEMGVYGFLRNAHKRRNLSIRLREFMPVGVRPIVVTVT